MPAAAHFYTSKIYTTGNSFTLPPAVTAWTNLTSDRLQLKMFNNRLDTTDSIDCLRYGELMS